MIAVVCSPEPQNHYSIIILASSACGALLMVVAVAVAIFYCACRKKKSTKSGKQTDKVYFHYPVFSTAIKLLHFRVCVTYLRIVSDL